MSGVAELPQHQSRMDFAVSADIAFRFAEQMVLMRLASKSARRLRQGQAMLRLSMWLARMVTV